MKRGRGDEEIGCGRASGQGDRLCNARGTAVTNGGGRGRFFFGFSRSSGQGDGLCTACGTVGTGRYTCGTAVTNASF